MKRALAFPFLAVLFCLLGGGADWLQFRGPHGASVSHDAAPPATWSEAENVAWKAELPGRGPSSPIVVRGRVFVTCSGGIHQDRLFVLGFDAESGREIWRREFWATGRTLTHKFSAVAAPTPASDGERVFALYSSNDLICLNLDGDLLWFRGLAYDYPKAGNDAGMGASPVVVAETVVAQVENQGDSFAAGIDVKTGETRWRLPREAKDNWTSPVVLPGKRNGHHVVLLQSHWGLSAHAVRTGEELWRYETPCATIASSACAGERIFFPSNGITSVDFPQGALFPRLVWDSSALNTGSSSPIVDGGRVYVINGAGVLSCGDAATGKRLWQLRLGGKHWSTPVIAGDRMVCINQDGKARVVQLGAKGKLLGSSDFGETILGSPAVVDGALFVRSDEHLWKIVRK